MELIEHKYLPQDLYDIVSPNKKEMLEQINHHIESNTINLLLIGKQHNFKSRAIHLIVKEYYKREGVHAYGSLILTIDCFNDINLSNTNNYIKTFRTLEEFNNLLMNKRLKKKKRMKEHKKINKL